MCFYVRRLEKNQQKYLSHRHPNTDDFIYQIINLIMSAYFVFRGIKVAIGAVKLNYLNCTHPFRGEKMKPAMF
jgi:hypothetical protein